MACSCGWAESHASAVRYTSQFHPLELTAAALTVPSATIRCPDPGATVSFAQDADLPGEHCVAHQGGQWASQWGWGGEHTVCVVPKAFWSVNSAPQPLPSRLRTAWAGERAQGVAGVGYE